MPSPRRHLLWLLYATFALSACSSSGDQGGEPPTVPTSFESDLPTTTGGDGRNAGASAPSAESSGDQSADSDGGDAQRAIVEADIIQLAGDRLYAMSRIAGLSVIDVSTPAAPKLLGRYREISGEPFELYLRGDVVLAMFSSWGEYVRTDTGYQYVQTSKLMALDTQNPAAITKLGSFDIAGAVSDSRIVGDILYVVGYENGSCWGCATNAPRTTVLSLDVKDPRAVRKVDELAFADANNSWGWNQRSITVTDQRMYVAGPEYGQNGPTGSTIQVVDISNPNGDMVEGAVVEAEGQVSSRWQMDEYQGVLRVLSQPLNWGTTDQRAPVLQTFSVASSAEVVPLGRVALVLPNNRETLRSARFDGPRGYAITAEQMDPLFILDLSDPAHPLQRGELEMPGFVYHMVPRGNRVIGLGFEQGNVEGGIAVSVFDVTNMDAPTQLSRVNFGGTWASLPEDQDRIHKAFRILDELGLVLVPFSGWSDVRSEDQRRCASRYQSGVQLLDLEGDTLRLRGVAPSVGAARRAFVHRDHLFTVSDQRVDTFSIADRSAPAAMGSLAMARYVEHVVPLAGGVVARVNSNYWSDSPWVDFVGAADVDAPQISLGELQIGDAIRGTDGCSPYSYVQAAFGSGSQVEILYSRHEYLSNDYTRSQQVGGVLVVDASDPRAPRLTGKLEWSMGSSTSTSSSSYYWYDGFYDYGMYNPARSPFARVGSALVMLEAGYHYTYNARGESERDLRVRVLNLANPAQPSSALLDLGDRTYSSLAASGDSVLLGYHEQAAGAQRARFFVQPLDLADMSQLRLASAINVPGALMHYDAAHGRIVTSTLTRSVVADLTYQECDRRFGFQRFTYPQNWDWASNAMPPGTCEGYQQTLHLVQLADGAATLEGSLPIEPERVVTSSSMAEDRLFAVLDTGHSYYYGVAADCWGPCGGQVTPSEPVDVLVMSGLASGTLAHGRLTVKGLDNPWWGFWGALPVHAQGTSALLTSYDQLSILDATVVEQPRLVSTQALYGGVSDVAFDGKTAYLALGQAGAQRVLLP